MVKKHSGENIVFRENVHLYSACFPFDTLIYHNVWEISLMLKCMSLFSPSSGEAFQFNVQWTFSILTYALRLRKRRGSFAEMPRDVERRRGAPSADDWSCDRGGVQRNQRRRDREQGRAWSLTEETGHGHAVGSPRCRTEAVAFRGASTTSAGRLAQGWNDRRTGSRRALLDAHVLVHGRLPHW